MTMKTRIKLVHIDSLSCEPILRRAPDGGLLCVCQCGDVYEPAPGNRVRAFRSEDEGETWRDLGLVRPLHHRDQPARNPLLRLPGGRQDLNIPKRGD